MKTFLSISIFLTLIWTCTLWTGAYGQMDEYLDEGVKFEVEWDEWMPKNFYITPTKEWGLTVSAHISGGRGSVGSNLYLSIGTYCGQNLLQTSLEVTNDYVFLQVTKNDGFVPNQQYCITLDPDMGMIPMSSSITAWNGPGYFTTGNDLAVTYAQGQSRYFYWSHCGYPNLFAEPVPTDDPMMSETPTPEITPTPLPTRTECDNMFTIGINPVSHTQTFNVYGVFYNDSGVLPSNENWDFKMTLGTGESDRVAPPPKHYYALYIAVAEPVDNTGGSLPRAYTVSLRSDPTTEISHFATYERNSGSDNWATGYSQIFYVVNPPLVGYNISLDCGTTTGAQCMMGFSTSLQNILPSASGFPPSEIQFDLHTQVAIGPGFGPFPEDAEYFFFSSYAAAHVPFTFRLEELGYTEIEVDGPVTQITKVAQQSPRYLSFDWTSITQPGVPILFRVTTHQDSWVFMNDYDNPFPRSGPGANYSLSLDGGNGYSQTLTLYDTTIPNKRIFLATVPNSNDPTTFDLSVVSQAETEVELIPITTGQPRTGCYANATVTGTSLAEGVGRFLWVNTSTLCGAARAKLVLRASRDEHTGFAYVSNDPYPNTDPNPGSSPMQWVNDQQEWQMVAKPEGQPFELPPKPWGGPLFYLGLFGGSDGGDFETTVMVEVSTPVLIAASLDAPATASGRIRYEEDWGYFTISIPSQYDGPISITLESIEPAMRLCLSVVEEFPNSNVNPTYQTIWDGDGLYPPPVTEGEDRFIHVSIQTDGGFSTMSDYSFTLDVRLHQFIPLLNNAQQTVTLPRGGAAYYSMNITALAIQANAATMRPAVAIEMEVVESAGEFCSPQNYIVRDGEMKKCESMNGDYVNMYNEATLFPKLPFSPTYDPGKETASLLLCGCAEGALTMNVQVGVQEEVSIEPDAGFASQDIRNVGFFALDASYLTDSPPIRIRAYFNESNDPGQLGFVASLHPYASPNDPPEDRESMDGGNVDGHYMYQKVLTKTSGLYPTESRPNLHLVGWRSGGGSETDTLFVEIQRLSEAVMEWSSLNEYVFEPRQVQFFNVTLDRTDAPLLLLVEHSEASPGLNLYDVNWCIAETPYTVSGCQNSRIVPIGDFSHPHMYGSCQGAGSSECTVHMLMRIDNEQSIASFKASIAYPEVHVLNGDSSAPVEGMLNSMHWNYSDIYYSLDMSGYEPAPVLIQFVSSGGSLDYRARVVVSATVEYPDNNIHGPNITEQLESSQNQVQTKRIEPVTAFANNAEMWYFHVTAPGNADTVGYSMNVQVQPAEVLTEGVDFVETAKGRALAWKSDKYPIYLKYQVNEAWPILVTSIVERIEGGFVQPVYVLIGREPYPTGENNDAFVQLNLDNKPMERNGHYIHPLSPHHPGVGGWLYLTVACDADNVDFELRITADLKPVTEMTSGGALSGTLASKELIYGSINTTSDSTFSFSVRVEDQSVLDNMQAFVAQSTPWPLSGTTEDWSRVVYPADGYATLMVFYSEAWMTDGPLYVGIFNDNPAPQRVSFTAVPTLSASPVSNFDPNSEISFDLVAIGDQSFVGITFPDGQPVSGLATATLIVPSGGDASLFASTDTPIPNINDYMWTSQAVGNKTLVIPVSTTGEVTIFFGATRNRGLLGNAYHDTSLSGLLFSVSDGDTVTPAPRFGGTRTMCHVEFTGGNSNTHSDAMTYPKGGCLFPDGDKWDDHASRTFELMYHCKTKQKSYATLFGNILYDDSAGGISGEMSLSMLSSSVTGAANSGSGVCVSVANASTVLHACADQQFCDDEWHHVAGVADRDAQLLSLYVDGHLLAQQGLGAFGRMGHQFGDQVDFSFGRYRDRDGFGEMFKGKMDDVRVWSEARSQVQIQYNMHREPPRDTTLGGKHVINKMMAYWRFNALDCTVNVEQAESFGTGDPCKIDKPSNAYDAHYDLSSPAPLDIPLGIDASEDTLVDIVYDAWVPVPIDLSSTGETLFGYTTNTSSHPVSLVVETLPAEGVLTVDGVAIDASHVVQPSDHLQYTPPTNAYGDRLTQFTARLQYIDGETDISKNLLRSEIQQITVHVSPVNDVPVITLNQQDLSVFDQAYTISDWLEITDDAFDESTITPTISVTIMCDENDGDLMLDDTRVSNALGIGVAITPQINCLTEDHCPVNYIQVNGTKDDVLSCLHDLIYTPPSGKNLDATIRVEVNDMANYGAGPAHMTYSLIFLHVFAATDPSKTVTTTSSMVLEAGVPQAVAIEMYDIENNHRRDCVDESVSVEIRKEVSPGSWDVSSELSADASPPCNDGVFSLNLIGDVAGAYRVKIMLAVPEANIEEESIVDSPYEVTVVPSDFDYVMSTCQGNGMSEAEMLAQTSFVVSAVDSYSNVITEGGNTVTVSFTKEGMGGECNEQSDPSCDIDIVDLNNGEYNVTYTVARGGKYFISVYLLRDGVPTPLTQCQNVMVSVPEVCPAGQYSPAVTGPCTPCPAGQYLNETDNRYDSACTDCPVGFYAPVPGMAVCDPCPMGEYVNEVGQTECLQCTDLEYQDELGQIDCKDCGPLSRSYSGASLPEHCRCVKGSYRADPDADCIDCPNGANCEGYDAQPVADTGFFASEKDNVFLECHPSEACLGGDAGCGEGYEGRICGDCSDGFYKLNDLCEPCPENSAAMLIIAGVVCVAVISILVLLQQQGIQLGTFSIFVSFMQVTTLFSRFQLEWPDIMLTFFQYLTIFQFNLDVVAPECQFPLTYYEKFLIKLAMPMAFVAALVLTGVVSLIIELSGSVFGKDKKTSSSSNEVKADVIEMQPQGKLGSKKRGKGNKVAPLPLPAETNIFDDGDGADDEVSEVAIPRRSSVCQSNPSKEPTRGAATLGRTSPRRDSIASASATSIRQERLDRRKALREKRQRAVRKAAMMNALANASKKDHATKAEVVENPTVPIPVEGGSEAKTPISPKQAATLSGADIPSIAPAKPLRTKELWRKGLGAVPQQQQQMMHPDVSPLSVVSFLKAKAATTNSYAGSRIRRTRILVDYLINAFFNLMIVFYVFMTATTLDYFRCIEQDDESVVLAANPGVNCYDDDWYPNDSMGRVLNDTYVLILPITHRNAYFPIAVAATGIYTFALPICAFLLLFFNRKKLRTSMAKARFGSLYRKYKTDWYYWEILVMVRKVVIVVSAMWFTQVLFQSVVGIIFLFFFVLTHTFARPFDSSNHNKIEFVGLVTNVLTLFAGLLFFSTRLPDEASENLVSYIVIVGVVASAISFVLFGAIEGKEMIKTLRMNRKRRGTIVAEDEKKGSSSKYALRTSGSTKHLRRMSSQPGQSTWDMDSKLDSDSDNDTFEKKPTPNAEVVLASMDELEADEKLAVAQLLKDLRAKKDQASP